MNKFIAIAGNIGAGKSSLVEFLDARYGFDPIYEPFAGNPYLDDFYGDMKKWAFHSQLPPRMTRMPCLPAVGAARSPWA